MADSIYVKVGNAVEPLDLGTDKSPEYVERIEALEQSVAGNLATQAAKDAAQDEAIAEAQSSAEEAQTTANQALDAAQNITVPVTSVNGQTGAVTVGTVRSVNGVAADAAGNVTVTHPVTSVNGKTGAVTINVAGTKVNNAVTADQATTTPNVYIAGKGSASENERTFTLPSGGTWRCFYQTYSSRSYYNSADFAGGKSVSSCTFIIAIRIA